MLFNIQARKKVSLGGNGMVAGGAGANSGLLGSAPSRGLGMHLLLYVKN